MNLYNWVTIVALLFCIPPMLYVRPHPPTTSPTPNPNTPLHHPRLFSPPTSPSRSLSSLSQFEGAGLAAGIQAAVAKVGAKEFSLMLFNVGLYYHLYNQVRVVSGRPSVLCSLPVLCSTGLDY